MSKMLPVKGRENETCQEPLKNHDDFPPFSVFAGISYVTAFIGHMKAFKFFPPYCYCYLLGG